MDKTSALKARLENLSPEQRKALLQQIARLREQQDNKPADGSAYPLSLAQRRLWMVSQLSPEACAAYNIAAVYAFDQTLDAQRLQQAWRQLLNRHEVLRSAFVQSGSDLQQVPRQASGWSLHTRALAGGQELEPELLQLAGEQAALPFDLAQDWLLRVIFCVSQAGSSGLVIVIHHSICDGLSIAGMIAELQQYYAGTLVAPDSTHKQYRDYIRFEQKADNSKAKAYWKDVFATEPETLDVMLDRPRPLQHDFRGSHVSRTLSAQSTAAFEALCRQHNATLYMGLVAAVQLLLARFANVGEVTIGTPVAGRPEAQFSTVVGPFVNTLALRQTVDTRQDFSQLLLQVRRRVLDGFQHQGLAFDELVTDLGFARDPARSPLFDVMLGLTFADDMTLEFGGSVGRELRIPSAFSKVDLTFHFEKGSDGRLRLDLEYATAVLLETTAQRLCEAWNLLAETLPQQPTRALGMFPLQSPAAEQRLLDLVNQTARPYPKQSGLIAEFRKTVQRFPDAMAVQAGDTTLSYQMLDSISDQVASALMLQAGYRPGSCIAFMLEKDQRAVVVILAILKCGCAYVPLAANTPQDRVEYVLGAGGVKLLIQQGPLPGLVPPGVITLEVEELLGNPLTARPTKQPILAGDTQHPAYLMFTSGSTGQPKGTLIDQKSVLRLVCNTDYHQVQPHERVLLTGSLAFDAATFEIWGALLNGGCVCIPAGTSLLEVHEFQSVIDRYQINTAFLTTGLFNQLVDNSLTAFASVQTVLTGGEKVSVDHVRKLLNAHPALTLLHVYGPTENTTFSSWHHIRISDLAQTTIPIGRPIANSRIYLLDARMQPVPVGVPGEIYCGGDGVALGYVEQDPDSPGTRQAFIDDPFLPAGSGRLYRTGDLAKWNDQLQLVFLGRNDRQVKVRGFRVELGEVEYYLRQLPGVVDACVQARGQSGNSELVAWLVTANARTYDVASVRDALKAMAPQYMLPAKVVCLERLPLNASGKVDLRALPAPEDVAVASDAAGAGLQGQKEIDLAALYASVLGLKAGSSGLDREANFFSLGGDSIRAIQLVSLARAQGYQFSLKDIFASETLAGLAATATVSSVHRSGETQQEAALTEGPLSPTQSWWLDQCGPAANHFNLSSVFEIEGVVNVDALRAALDQMLEIHPALRLSLKTPVHSMEDPVAGRQWIRPTGQYVLRQCEDAKTRQLCWQDLQKDINLDKGILLAVGVASDTQRSWLAIVVHHLAADEVSGRIFAGNLERLYHHHQALRTCNTSSGVEPVREALGMINWSVQLQSAVQRGVFDNDLVTWQSLVARGNQILSEQSASLFTEAAVERQRVVLALTNLETQTLLMQASALLHMPAQDVLLASFVRAWRLTTKQSECVLTLEGHGRQTFDGAGDCSSTLGWFTSLYPLVCSSRDAHVLEDCVDLRRNLSALPAFGFSYLPLRYYGAYTRKDSALCKSLDIRPWLSFNYLGDSEPAQHGWLQPATESAGDDHGADVTQPFKLDVLARIAQGQFELILQGQSPHSALTLEQLAQAWAAQLFELANALQLLADGQRLEPGISRHLLALSDTLVPFDSLPSLDNSLKSLGIDAEAVEEILPLTGMQAGIWLQCSTQSGAYQDQVALRLHQTLDLTRFQRAVLALVAETQALRAGFAQVPDGELWQLVFRDRAGSFQCLSAAETGSSDSDLAQFRATLRARPCDLLHDPLFRLTLVALSTDCYELIIDFHHIAIDGWTSALLMQRLESLYFSDPDSADNKAASGMRAWFEWLYLQDPAQARQYWQQLLGDYGNRCDVPAHRPRLPVRDSEPMFVETRTGSGLQSRLQNWCEKHGLTLNAAIQSLWGLLLSRLTGSDDVVFGATVSGRDSDLDGVANIAGMLINTLPVRIRSSEASTFLERVRATAQQFADSMSYGHLALAEIQTLTPARSDLITHTLVFENYPSSSTSARWSWQPQAIFDPMHFEFGVIVAPLPDDLSFRFVADGGLYTVPRLQQMGEALCRLLDAVLESDSLADLQTVAATGAWSLSANFTADSLVGMLQYHEYLSGRSGAVTLLPYDQSVQELVNPGSRLRQLPAHQHIVLWRPDTDGQGNVLQTASANRLEELVVAMVAYARACSGSRLAFVACPSQRNNPAQYREFYAYVKGAFAGLSNTSVLLPDDLEEMYALQQSCLPADQIFGDIPYTQEFFAALATQLVRERDLHTRRPIKVYVVDADDTLWGGIVGEEGAEGIRLDAPHLLLQQKLINARSAGALICLATKNNEDDVRAVFAAREMPLRWEHLTRVCAGWKPKSDSILALAEDLSLGLDSFVFIDDSPLECEQVMTACPGVVTIHLPQAQQRERFLQHLWLLDARAATREDQARAQMYQEELQRKDARKSSGSYAGFLASLDIHMDVRPLASEDLARTAQLSQRTNQFNTTGRRYTENELVELQTRGADIRSIRVRDKYGDYGLTGSILIRRDANAWTVFGLMLSCRVLGRGVEHRLLQQIAAEAEAAGASTLVVDFIKLARNAPAQQFLVSLMPSSLNHRAQQQTQAFCLAVADADTWQPGGDDEQPDQGFVEDRDQSSPAQDVVDSDSRALSGYYTYLASELACATSILGHMQQSGRNHYGSPTASSNANKTRPQSDTEITLAAFFGQLLGHSEIFREDSFYELGGHSLKAVMLFSRIVAHFGVTLDFRDLQMHPSVAELARCIDGAAPLPRNSGADQPLLLALPDADSYAVSPGQSRLWMLEQIRGEGPSPFHMHATLLIPVQLDRRALDQAVSGLFARHESLRTRFQESLAGLPEQVVVPLSALDTSVQWLEPAVHDAQLDELAHAHSSQAFDLRQAPLIRISAADRVSGGCVLFMTLHHIISDGWSIGVLSRELSDAYETYTGSKHSTQSQLFAEQHPGPALQFRDFARWQLDWLKSGVGVNALEFWRNHLEPAPEALQLPTQTPRPALKQSVGATARIDIESSVWSGLRTLLLARGISEFSGLLAALQWVLARLSGQQDFCIGTAVAGRQHHELESVTGFFVNVLPLRSSLARISASDLSLSVFLQAVADEVNDCLSHQAVPFDAIVSVLDLVRDPGRSPLFDVLLVMQNTDIDDLHFGGLAASVYPVDSGTSQYDLTLSAFPVADGTLKLVADYDSAIYSSSQIERLLRCLSRTVQSFAAALAQMEAGEADQMLTSLPWLQDTDVLQLRAFEGAVPGDKSSNEKVSLAGLFMAQVPDAQGRIRDELDDWSYADLERQMYQVSAQLRALASQAAQTDKKGPANIQLHVGVIGQRSVRSVAAMLGVMHAGAVYIPLDTSNPLERLRLIIEEGDVAVLLSTDDPGAGLVQSLLKDNGLAHLQHLRYDHAPAPEQAEPVQGKVAYMIFTSGSTGKPKGVQISHASFAAMIRQQIPAFDVTAHDVCGQFAALSFDASLSEIFLALGTGASLTIAPDGARADIDVFIRWLNQQAVTVITLPPAFLRALNQRPLGTLRVLITAGDAAVADDMKHYAATLTVINAYGPTETSVCATVYPVNIQESWPFGVPIGRALPGVLLSVRDAQGERVPVGCVGELLIGGTTVAVGYYGSPALSAQKFITLADDPQQQRWYRSGDLVRWREDGALEFAGRVDAQIKLRGYRIEPGEIEYAARRIEGVRDALVLVHPQSGLMLFCLAEDELLSAPDAALDILSRLSRVLPRHMMPADVLLLEHFPVSSAGKIARAQLIALASERKATAKDQFDPLVTVEEQVLAKAWQRVLKREQIGRYDDFFALGGDSIKALEIISALRSDGWGCELKDFFAAPVVAQLALLLKTWRCHDHHAQALSGKIALLPVQQWFLHSREKGAASHFHIVVELELVANLTEALIAGAITELMQHHDSLRARFYQQNGQWHQDIQGEIGTEQVFRCYRQLSTVSMASDDRAVESLACAPFDLDTGPLCRFVLVQGPDGTSKSLVMSLHHLIADWVSLRILVSDLNHMARARLGGDVHPGQLQPPHLLRLVSEQRASEQISGPATDTFRQAWSVMREQADKVGLHSDLQTLHLQMNAGELSRLRAALQQRSTHDKVEYRLQHMLLAATLTELGDLLPGDILPLLVETHGRDGELNLSRQLAWLTRARLVNVDMEQLRKGNTLSIAHRLLQLDTLSCPDVFVCVAEQPLGYNVLPALMSFNYLGEFGNSQQPDDLFRVTGRVFEQAMAPNSPVDVPLHVECYVVDSVLEIQVAWSPAVFDSQAMQIGWEAVLRRCLALQDDD